MHPMTAFGDLKGLHVVYSSHLMRIPDQGIVLVLMLAF